MNSTVRRSFSLSLAVILALATIQPFGLDEMERGRLLYLLQVGIFTFISGILSELPARFINKLIFKDCDEHPYLCILVSFVCNVPVMALFLAFANMYMGHFPFSFDLYLSMMVYVAILSLFLYIWTCLKVKNEILEKKLDDVLSVNLLLEQRQEELAARLEQKFEQSQNKLILRGQTSSSALEVTAEAIVYIESIANYADVCYMEDDEIRHKTLRITLKGVNESLGECVNLVQCHRAFIVNLDFVVAMEKIQSAYQLQLFGMDKRIPVSRSNCPAIRERLASGKQ